MTKQEVASLLREHALMLELLAEDAFRARAFDFASRQLESTSDSLDILLTGGRLATVKGIGKNLAAVISEIANSGTFAELEQTRARIPVGVFDLLRVEGLGPKKARILWQNAHVTSLIGLEAALLSGDIDKLPGFGAKTTQKFLAGLAFLKAMGHRHLRHHALRAAHNLRIALESIPNVQEVFFGGSLRRGCETIGDLDVLVIAPQHVHSELKRAIKNVPGATWTETGTMFRGEYQHIPVQLSIIAPESSALTKLLVTGSKEHIAALKEHAIKAGLNFDASLNISASEAEIYHALRLEFVPPALRESNFALLPLGSGSYPKPVDLTDVRGILHVHTTASDGHHSLRDIAAAMMERGFEYVGIADHSQSAAYARGLTPERVREQWRDIDALNVELAPFRIFKGTEADIQADGTVDFDDELLAGFDFVIASIHSGFNMTEAQATNRLIRALENPHVDILGHLTGRLLLERNGYPVNHEQIITCAARHGKAIELNCNPHRLDVDWRWLALCEEMNVPVPLCPDAHSVEGLDDIRYGIEVAAKGPLTAKNCPSAWSAARLLDWFKYHKML